MDYFVAVSSQNSPRQSARGPFPEVRMLRSIMDFLFKIAVCLVMIIVVETIVVNYLLNCQTWDRTLWTPTSSCITPLELLGIE